MQNIKDYIAGISDEWNQIFDLLKAYYIMKGNK